MQLAQKIPRLLLLVAAPLALASIDTAWSDDLPTREQCVERFEELGLGFYDNPDPYDTLDVNGREFTDRDMACLRLFPELKWVSIADAGITGESLQVLSKLPNLKMLHLIETPLGEGAEHIGRLLSLTHLQLISAGITDDDAEHFGQLRNLRVVNLSHGMLTDEGLQHFGELTNLRAIWLTDMPALAGSGLVHLDCKDLEWINLNDTSLTDESLQHLSEFQALEQIAIERTLVTDAGLASLANLPSLTRLDLADCRITNAGAETISTIPSLTVVDLSGTDIADDGIAALATLPNIEVIWIERTDVSDAGLDHLHGVKTLDYLLLSEDANVTEEGIGRLQMHLPELDIVRSPDSSQ